jgi:hypothetical protein
MRAERVELDNGELVRTGNFDKRDAVVPHRTFRATASELVAR